MEWVFTIVTIIIGAIVGFFVYPSKKKQSPSTKKDTSKKNDLIKKIMEFKSEIPQLKQKKEWCKEWELWDSKIKNFLNQ